MNLTVYTATDVQRRELALETVAELNRCLDQLEDVQSNRNIGTMAVHKVYTRHSFVIIIIIIIIIIIGGLSEVRQIRPFGTDRSPVSSTHRGINSRPSERIVNRVLFRAGPKDRVGLRRQSGAQLSFPAHFSHCSALQLHLVAQQLSQLR